MHSLHGERRAQQRDERRLVVHVASRRDTSGLSQTLYMTMTYMRGLCPQEAKRRRSAGSMKSIH